MDLVLLKVHFIMQIMVVLWLLCAVIMILVILIQKGRGGGLSGAFGGGMASGILGTKTGDFLTWVTVGMVGLFLLLSIVLAKYYRPMAMGVAEEPPAATQPVTTPELPETKSTDMPEAGEQEMQLDMPDTTETPETNLP